MTTIIIGITILAYLATSNNRELFEKLSFDPYMVAHRGQQYRIFTHAFLHADFGHLAINMFVLYNFGTAVESFFQGLFGDMGAAYYLLLYFGGIVASSLPTLRKEKDNFYYRAIGASGAVAAVLFSFIIMNPTAGLRLLILPFFDIPAIVLGVLYLWYEKRMADRNVNDNIGHDAHYWGAVFGAVITIIFKPTLALSFVTQILSLFS
jgi:membrane associated rhomboid family serine protease